MIKLVHNKESDKDTYLKKKSKLTIKGQRNIRTDHWNCPTVCNTKNTTTNDP